VAIAAISVVGSADALSAKSKTSLTNTNTPAHQFFEFSAGHNVPHIIADGFQSDVLKICWAMERRGRQ
jgi:hypothetical protein